MSDSPAKPLIFAAGAVGSLLLAISSRNARKRKQIHRRERHNGAHTPAQTDPSQTLAHDLALSSHSNAPTAPHPSTTAPSVAWLLLHGLVSILLLSTASLWRPAASTSEEVWRQLVGSILLTLFTAHILSFFLAPLIRSSRTSTPAHAALGRAPALTSRPETVAELNGVWIKDRQESDSMDPVLDLMKFNSLLRMAVGLIKGVEIKTTPGEEFQFGVMSGVLWFQIREKYKLNGEEARHRRRDFRGGGSMGRATESPEGGVEIKNKFNAPMAGTMDERFYCPSSNVLHVDTFLHCPERGPGISYRQIYRRKGTF